MFKLQINIFKISQELINKRIYALVQVQWKVQNLIIITMILKLDIKIKTMSLFGNNIKD